MLAKTLSVMLASSGFGTDENTTGNGQINKRGICHIVWCVFGKPGVKQYLGCFGISFPNQTHVDRLSTLHRNQWRDFATSCMRAIRVWIRKARLGCHVPSITGETKSQKARKHSAD